MIYNLVRKKDNNVNFGIIYQSDNYNESWVLEIENKTFKFLINNENELPPSNVYENDGIIFFELNNKVFLFSKINGSLLFFSKLFDDFTEIKETYNGYIIITDTSILLISKYNFCVLKVVYFPDTIMSYQIKEKKIMLKTFEGDSFEVDL